MSADGTPYLGNFDFLHFQVPLADFDDSDVESVSQAQRWSAPDQVSFTKRSDVFAFAIFSWEVRGSRSRLTLCKSTRRSSRAEFPSRTRLGRLQRATSSLRVSGRHVQTLRLFRTRRGS